ncbi:MAG TPA: ABC transporter ATP-binding protein [Stellaceae bacterium]|jgi:branched-chain amino acid transport system ATP-binding protein|nr:ABC transporter ATP-binding protein [Stellaceae bacterium]
MSLLSLTAVSRTFGRVVALQDVDLEMEEGRLYAVIGPNGAGKTTLFNLISGFYPASSGQIRFDGQQINRVPAANRVTLGLVRTFQITEIFPELSVFENVRIGVEAEARCSARPWWSPALSRQINERVDELLSITGLTAQSGRTVSELAHGDQRVVEVTMALSRRPKLLMLDEPTAGMGQSETEHMVKLIRDLHVRQKQSILFIEHDMDLVFGIADRITVLNYGKVLATGTPKEVAADHQVQAAYLGEAE